MLQAEQLIAGCRGGKPLTNGPDGEAADLRTAISRAYYATFLTAVAFLNDLGYSVTDSSKCHGAVKTALIQSNEVKLERVASDYGTLGTYRRKADYDLDSKDVENLSRAEEMLKLCQSVWATIGSVGKRTQSDLNYRALLVASIDAWRERDGVKEIQKTTTQQGQP